MIDQRLFYEAHVDTQDNYFLLSDQAYEDYRSARLAVLRTEKNSWKKSRQNTKYLPSARS